jgi:hypothetical protein
LPGAVNAQVNYAPAAQPSAAKDQENAAVAPAGKPASKKRKSTEEPVPVEPIDLDEIDVYDLPMDKNCDQVRRMINRFLDTGAMSKTALARAMGVSGKSLTGFLGTHGPMNGANFAAYGAAWEYFKKREIAGLKMPVKKQKTDEEESGKGDGKAKGKTAGKAAVVDVSDIVLDGEENDEVPVFDSCDEVRKKISAYIQRPGVTQASLCREIHAQLKGPGRPAKPFQGSQLARFRGLKGTATGASSMLFYGAYVFFEKLRIKEGKPKSKHRQQMEKVWGPEGFDRDQDASKP